MREKGYPAYTTSAGWLGYSDEKMRRLSREGVAEGWTHFKKKVGGDIEEDIRRARILREEIGWDRKLMMDANQVWDVDETVDEHAPPGRLRPLVDRGADQPGRHPRPRGDRQRIAPIGVATGEHCQNRVMFKQLLQAKRDRLLPDRCCRLGGVNEVLPVLLMAAKFGVPVCPHAGGVGLCEYVQHISMFDYICVSASLENRMLEYVDHLHEHFVDPVVIRNGRYMPPQQPRLQHRDACRHARALRIPERRRVDRIDDRRAPRRRSNQRNSSPWPDAPTFDPFLPDSKETS